MNIEKIRKLFKFPEVWNLKPLNEVVYFQEGPGVRKHQFTSDGIKLLNGTNIDNNQLDLNKTNTYISKKEAFGKYKHFLIDEGDLLIASSGISVTQFNQKIAFASAEHLPLCMNTSTIRFKTLDKKLFDINFFKWFLTTSFFKRQIQYHITGTAQLNFGPSHLEQMVVPIFDLPKQKKIAEILDKAATLSQKRKQQIELLDEYLKSVFYEMFGDSVKNVMNWDEKLLRDVSNDIVDCPHSTPIHLNEITEYPCIRTSEIKNGYINWSSMKYVSKTAYEIRTKRLVPVHGDIIYGREGSYGDAIIVPKNTNICLGQRVMLLRPNSKIINPTYFWAIIRSDRVYLQAKSKNAGSTVGHVNVKDIIRFTIPVPPLPLQMKFAKIVEQVEKAKEKMQESLGEMDNLFNSLMQRAFKGEL